MKNYLLIAAMLLGLATSAQQTAKSLTGSNNVVIGFYEYKPADYNANPNTKYPLIVFMHGIGERGNGTTELSKVAGNAIPRYIRDGETMTYTWNGKTETFLVLSPQLSNSYGSWQPFYVEEMIKYAKQNLRIDTNRIIVTGLSLGGGGVWKYAAGSSSNAKKLAAIAPVCGTCENVSWANIAGANLPTWGFHAEDDGTVPSSCTKGAVTAINNGNGAVKAYSTIWPTGQHWIWDRAYDRGYGFQNPNVWEWMLAQNKSLAPNKRPTANAGADITTTTGAGTATVNGSGSTDSDGSIVRYVWRLVSGPTQVKFNNNSTNITTPTATVTGMTVAGTYQIELKAVDDRCDWATDMMTITVTSGGTAQPQPQPQPPVTNKPAIARAGADITITLPVNMVSLDGSASSDPDGEVKAYEWSKLSGPAATITSSKTAKTTVTGLVEGVYKFRLSVWGDNWQAVNDTVMVTVIAAPVVIVPNKAPVAIAGDDVINTLPADGATLNGAASYDTDGNISTYLWTKVSGPAQGTLANANTATATVSKLGTGTYCYRLQVTDNKGATCADSVYVTVKSAPVTGNSPVKVIAGDDQTIILPVNKAILDGSASYDVDGAVKAYEWTKISGPACTFVDQKSALALATNLVAGTYKFKLMVWGDNWSPKSDTMIVTVQAPATPGNIAPVVNAGSNMTTNLPANSVTLNGSASYDIDGSIISYKWSKIGGPAQFVIANDTAASTTVSNLTAGTYQFRLEATDNGNATNSDTVTVQVIAPANSPVVAKAGDDQMISLPANSVNVDGSASFDVDGAIKAYEWRKISGPSSYSIANAKTAKTTISNLVAGTYKFELMAWGDNWAPRADTMQVTVSEEVVVAAVSSSAMARTAETSVASSVSVFPSPATSTINMQYQDGNNGQATAMIYDISGKIVAKINFMKESTVYQRSINIANLKAGVYHMAVISKDKRIVTNFVKQ